MAPRFCTTLRHRLGLLALAIATLGAPNARAEPQLRVQAGTQITLHAAATRDARRFELQGSLRDDADGALSGRVVVLEIAPADDPDAVQRSALRTGEDGSFGANLTLPPAGSQLLRVHFGGDTHHAASTTEQLLDPAKATVRLQFIEPSAAALDLDQPMHALVLRASSARGGGGLALAIRDERGRALGSGTTGEDGAFRVELPAAAFGAPGKGHLRAETAGDALRAPAQAEIALVRFRRSALALEAREARDGRIELQGTLHSGGSGLPRKAIDLYASDRRIATVLTDASGAFRHTLTADEDASLPSALRLQARFESDTPVIGSSRSQPVVLALEGPARPNAFWLLVPFALCAVLVYGLVRGQARPAPQAPPAERVGIHASQPRARGRAAERVVGGSVRDAAHDRPLPALVTLTTREGRVLELQASAEGRFASPPLEDGDYTLEIALPGYASLGRSLAIPHRGEWSDMWVALQSLRAAAVMAYKPAALRMLPSADLWPRMTPRETLDGAVRSGRATAAFEQLTERVERAAYAQTPPSEEDVAAVAQSAAEALARFPSARPPSPPSSSDALRARIPHRR